MHMKKEKISEKLQLNRVHAGLSLNDVSTNNFEMDAASSNDIWFGEENRSSYICI